MNGSGGSGMNVKNAERLPSVSVWARYGLWLEEEGATVAKKFRLPENASVNELVAKILPKIREAERDFAALKYGDSWKDHVPKRAVGAPEATSDEFALVVEAVRMIKGEPE